MPDAPILLTLDKPREVKWTLRAQMRLASLPRPPSYADLANPHRVLYAVSAFIWAALVDRSGPYADPEDVAEALDTEERGTAAYQAIVAMLMAAGIIAAKKKAGSMTPPAGAGRGPSSSSASAPR